MNSNGIPANVNRQLAALIREGLTTEQACASLGLDVEAGQLALMVTSKGGKQITISDLIDSFRPEAVNILIEIARCSERDADRVKACQILLEGKGVMPEVNAAAATKLFQDFEKMKRAVGVSPIIEAESEVTTVSSPNSEQSFGK